MIGDYKEFSENFIKDKIFIFRSTNEISIGEQESIVRKVVGQIDSRMSDSYINVIEGMNHKNLETDIRNEGFFSEYFKSRMHVDLPPSGIFNGFTFLISMCMKKFNCTEGNGNTYFLNMEKCFEKISISIEDLIDIRISFTHDDFEYISPVFFIHPYSGKPVLFWPTINVDYFSGNKQIFNLLKQEVLIFFSDYENWYEHKWKENDVVVFDNSSMLHAFTPGWGSSQRVFNQVSCLNVVPEYLVNGVNIWENWNLNE